MHEKTNVHERTLSVLKSPSNPVRTTGHKVINQIQTRFFFTFFYCLTLHTETSFKIRQFGSREQKENTRRRCWLIKRATWQRCLHHSQADQKSAHASLSTVSFVSHFCFLISIHGRKCLLCVFG